MSQKKLLLETYSLDKFLRVKNLLDNNGIEYFDIPTKNPKLGLFLYQLFTRSTATYGMHGEHDMLYSIHVNKEDFEKAQNIIEKYY